MLKDDKSNLFKNMNDKKFLFTLRNALAHNNYSLKLNHGKIMINVYPKGQSKKMGANISLDLIEKYINKINSYVDINLVKMYNQNRSAFLLKDEVYFAGGILKLANPRKLNKEKEFQTFYSAGRCPTGLKSRKAKTLDMIASDLCDSFTKLIIENPNLKGKSLKFKLNQKYKKCKINYKDLSTFDTFKNDEFLYAHDVLRYAQFILSSDCYDKQEDYNHNEKLRRILKGDINNALCGIRNSLTHHWYIVREDKKIVLGDLLESGIAKLNNSKAKIHNMIKDKADSRETCKYIAQNQITKEDLKNVATLKVSELINICNILIEDYLSRENEDFTERK